jgi:hypothetical protein
VKQGKENVDSIAIFSQNYSKFNVYFQLLALHSYQGYLQEWRVTDERRVEKWAWQEYDAKLRCENDNGDILDWRVACYRLKQ